MSRSEQTRKRTSKVLDSLALARRQDLQEVFEEEMEETVMQKRGHRSDDSDSDEEETLDYEPVKKKKTFKHSTYDIQETFSEEILGSSMRNSTRQNDDGDGDKKDLLSYEPPENNNFLEHLAPAQRQGSQGSSAKIIQEAKSMKRARQDDDGSEDTLSQGSPKKKKPISKGAELLAKMGFKTGEGLGKSGQGRTEPIPLSTQRGRAGLGHHASAQLGRDWDVTWDSSDETKNVEETVMWLSCSKSIRSRLHEELNDDWIVEGERKETIDDEDQYCDGELLRKMLEAKSVFDQLDDRDLRDARTRANPYETIGPAFFQNRAAVKMANMDRVFDWLLTKEKEAHIEEKNPTKVMSKDEKTRILAHEPRNTDRTEPLFYFADVCAGPGGFTEYVLWRKAFYNAKGFGMTLKGKDDFNFKRFTAASPVYFETYYGKHDDGDVTKTENITSFAEVVLRGTNGNGVDLMMADGGFSVEQQENIQEILSKRLYLCQFLVALSILRKAAHAKGGVFVCKLFDIFTPFSIGLIYLMYTVFERISIHKPNTSRPANSERYIICDSPMEPYLSKVRDYFTKINETLERLSSDKSRDVREIMPADIIQSDEKFMDYIIEHNERLIRRQTNYLNKYRIYAKNAGELDRDQARLRDDSLRYWKLPDITRKRPHDLYEPVNRAVTRLMKQIIEFPEVNQEPPPFTKEVVDNTDTNRLRFAELRMCALTEKNYSLLLLFSTSTGVYYNSSQQHGFERLPLETNLPRDTVLFVQKTKVFDKISGAGRLEAGVSALRILDAAQISGDDISNLPYNERLAAAEKMCKAIKITHQNDKKLSPVYVAKVFSLDQMRNELERFHVLDITGEQVAVIEELPSTFFYCRGMRVVSILADSWVMCWSKSKEKPYAYKTTPNASDSAFSDQFELKRCCVNFWKAIVTKIRQKIHPGSQKRTDVHQWIWDWTQRTIEGECYGPRAILEDKDHSVGPTWRSICRMAENEKARKCIKH